jgi:hypothetical protein
LNLNRSLIVVLMLPAAWGFGCNAQAVLTRQVEARQLASELQVQLTKAADASNRSVMSDNDEASAAAAREAGHAAEEVLRSSQQLRSIWQSMGYSEELALLDAFDARFAEYRMLDGEILSLAVENTNVKAQRLSFGPASEAALAFRTTIDAAAKAARPADSSRADAVAAGARAAVLQIQVLQAPHIAESDDLAMTRLEEQMAASERMARQALDQLRALLPPSSTAQLTAALATLDRFMMLNGEIVMLSRRNSDVRSLALTLGRKRAVIAQCEDQIRALRETLAKHEMKATR